MDGVHTFPLYVRMTGSLIMAVARQVIPGNASSSLVSFIRRHRYFKAATLQMLLKGMGGRLGKMLWKVVATSGGINFA